MSQKTNKFIVLFIFSILVFTFGIFIVLDKNENKTRDLSDSSSLVNITKSKELLGSTNGKKLNTTEEQLKKQMLDDITAMDEILKEKPSISNIVPISTEQQMQADYQKTQELITEVKQLTNKSFDFDIEQQQIDPVTSPELYEIEQGFDKIEQQMQQMVQDMQ
jgi:hypothetical protein